MCFISLHANLRSCVFRHINSGCLVHLTACAARVLQPCCRPAPPHRPQTTPNFRDTGRPSVTIVTPQNLKIEGKQRQPTKPAQIADPLCECLGGAVPSGWSMAAGRLANAARLPLLVWSVLPPLTRLCIPHSLPPPDGEWLDTFITVLDPQQGLAQPVGGLIGERLGRRVVHSAPAGLDMANWTQQLWCIGQPSHEEAQMTMMCQMCPTAGLSLTPLHPLQARRTWAPTSCWAPQPPAPPTPLSLPALCTWMPTPWQPQPWTAWWQRRASRAWRLRPRPPLPAPWTQWLTRWVEQLGPLCGPLCGLPLCFTAGMADHVLVAMSVPLPKARLPHLYPVRPPCLTHAPHALQVLSEALEDQLAAELTETEAAPAPAAQPEQQPEEQPAAAAPAPAA